MKEEHIKPSIFSSLYWMIQDKKIDPNVLLEFLELYWPSFMKKDDLVFLKDKFSETEYRRLIKEKVNAEYWINLLTIDDFFQETSEGDKSSIKLAKALVEIWSVKLKSNYPSMKFEVKYLHDTESGDYGLTFYQCKKNSLLKK